MKGNESRYFLNNVSKIVNFDDFCIKRDTDLTDDERFILGIIKNGTGIKIGELYKFYQEKGGSAVYKTFQRKIKKLYENNFINIERKSGGKEGNTTIVNFGTMKKLTDY